MCWSAMLQAHTQTLKPCLWSLRRLKLRASVEREPSESRSSFKLSYPTAFFPASNFTSDGSCLGYFPSFPSQKSSYVSRRTMPLTHCALSLGMEVKCGVCRRLRNEQHLLYTFVILSSDPVWVTLLFSFAHFINKETRSLIGFIICPRSHSRYKAEVGFKHREILAGIGKSNYGMSISNPKIQIPDPIQHT